MSSKKVYKKERSSKAGSLFKVRDYSKEPYFVKKAESAKRTIEKYGLPEELLTGKNKT